MVPRGPWLGASALAAAWAWRLALAGAESVAEAGAGAGADGAARPNATVVYVRRVGHESVYNMASIALLAAAGAVLVVVCAWLVAVDVKVRRQQARRGPRPPPRPSHLLLLPPAPGDVDEGYVEPCCAHPLPGSPCAVDARRPARAHSYLLVLGGDGGHPYEEVLKAKDGGYLQPRLIALPPRGKAAEAEEGYLPMSGRALPSVLKVLQGGQLAIDLSAVYDEYLHMAPGRPEPQHPPGPPSDAQELKVFQEPPLIPTLATVSDLPSPTQPYMNAAALAKAASMNSYESVAPFSPARHSPSSIQSRMLPPPPLPPLPAPPGTPRLPPRVV